MATAVSNVEIPAEQAEREDLEELRLAVVMSGGVSLCVWMGGVANELDRLVNGVGAYGEILKELRRVAIVDVVTGTSAGGINGAFLAASRVYEAPLGRLRDLWLDRADFEELLRKPNSPDGDPRSLLQGDEYLRPELEKVLTGLGAGTPRTLTDQPPVRLLVTTTLVDGTLRGFLDARGGRIFERTHLGLFRFDEQPESAPGGRDISTARAGRPGGDFAGEGWTARLSLAARCSSAHPGGFEAAYVPINDSSPNDMATVAQWPNSQWTLDGGLLANRPVEQAIDLIVDQRATRQVRRMLMLVVPQEVGSEEIKAKADEPPSFLQTLGHSVSVPRQESIVDALDAIERHNRRVGRTRDVRRNLLRGTTRSTLVQSARPLMGLWNESRRRSFASEVLDRLLQISELSQQQLEAIIRSLDEPDPPDIDGWDVDREWEFGSATLEASLQFVSALLRSALRLTPSVEGDARSQEVRTLLVGARRQLQATRDEVRALHDAEISEAARRALGSDPDPGTEASEVRKQLSLAAIRTAAVARLTAQAIGALFLYVGESPDAELFARGGRKAADLEELVSEASLLADDATTVDSETSFRGLLNAPNTTSSELQALTRLDDSGLLAGPLVYRQEYVKGVAQFFVALDALQAPVKEGEPPREQLIEFIQLTAAAPNELDSERADAGSKLAGLQLAHFGAFYKRSWRQNDWMWGRTDGAYQLVLSLLDADRLRQLRISRLEAVELIERIATAASPDDNIDEDLSSWLALESEQRRPAVEAELAYLDDPTMPSPDKLVRCARWIARRIQMEIARVELPDLLQAILDDHNRGALLLPATDNFARRLAAASGFPIEGAALRDVGKQYRSALASYEKELKGRAGDAVALPRPPQPVLAPNDVAKLFPQNPVPRERIEDDLGSDLSTKVVSQAALIAVSVGAGGRSGLGPLRPILASLRKSLTIVYLLAIGITRRTRTTTAITALLVATSAAAVAITAVKWADSTGTEQVAGLGLAFILYIAAVVLAGIRTGDARVGVGLVLLIVVLWLASLLFVAQGDHSFWQKLVAVVVITIGAGVVVAALEGWWVAIQRRHWQRAVGAVVGVLLIGVGVWAAAGLSIRLPRDQEARCSSLIGGAFGKDDRVTVTPPKPEGGSSTTSSTLPKSVEDTCTRARLLPIAAIVGSLIVILGGWIFWVAVRKKKKTLET